MRVRLSTVRRWGRRKKTLRALADPAAHTGMGTSGEGRGPLAAVGLGLSLLSLPGPLAVLAAVTGLPLMRPALSATAAAAGIVCGLCARARARAAGAGNGLYPSAVAIVALLVGCAGLIGGLFALTGGE